MYQNSLKTTQIQFSRQTLCTLLETSCRPFVLRVAYSSIIHIYRHTSSDSTVFPMFFFLLFYPPKWLAGYPPSVEPSTSADTPPLLGIASPPTRGAPPDPPLLGGVAPPTSWICVQKNPLFRGGEECVSSNLNHRIIASLGNPLNVANLTRMQDV